MTDSFSYKLKIYILYNHLILNILYKLINSNMYRCLRLMECNKHQNFPNKFGTLQSNLKIMFTFVIFKIIKIISY